VCTKGASAEGTIGRATGIQQKGVRLPWLP
jgi:hypothetical protein